MQLTDSLHIWFHTFWWCHVVSYWRFFHNRNFQKLIYLQFFKWFASVSRWNFSSIIFFSVTVILLKLTYFLWLTMVHLWVGCVTNFVYPNVNNLCYNIYWSLKPTFFFLKRNIYIETKKKLVSFFNPLILCYCV